MSMQDKPVYAIIVDLRHVSLLISEKFSNNVTCGMG